MGPLIKSAASAGLSERNSPGTVATLQPYSFIYLAVLCPTFLSPPSSLHSSSTSSASFLLLPPPPLLLFVTSSCTYGGSSGFFFLFLFFFFFLSVERWISRGRRGVAGGEQKGGAVKQREVVCRRGRQETQVSQDSPPVAAPWLSCRPAAD